MDDKYISHMNVDLNGDGEPEEYKFADEYLRTKVFDMIYPVGAIYMSVTDVSPQILFGGEWEQIKDTFLLSAGDIYDVGTVGGKASYAITTEELPAHTHTFKGSEITTDKESQGHTHEVNIDSQWVSSDHTHNVAGNTGYANASGYESLGGDFVKYVGNNGGFGWEIDWTSQKIFANSSHYHMFNVDSGGIKANHYHNVKGSTQGVSANHTHKVTAAGTIEKTGNGKAIDNMPPYLTVYMWKRTA